MKNKIIIILSLIGVLIFIYNYYIKQKKIIKGNQSLNFIISSCEENIKRDMFLDKNNTYFMYYFDTFKKIIPKKKFQKIGETFKKAKFHEKLSGDAYLKSHDFFIKIKENREEKNRPNKEILLNVGFDLFKRAIHHKNKKYELLHHANKLLKKVITQIPNINLSSLQHKLLELDSTSECIDREYLEKSISINEKFEEVIQILESLKIELVLLDDYIGSKDAIKELHRINNDDIFLKMTKYNLSCYYGKIFKVKEIRKLYLKDYTYLLEVKNPKNYSIEESISRIAKMFISGRVKNVSIEDVSKYKNDIRILLK